MVADGFSVILSTIDSPGDDAAILLEGGKGGARGEKTRVTPEVSSSATALLSPPWLSGPHVTTLPLSLRAAKARWVEKMRITPEETASDTSPNPPPKSASSHVTTLPSSLCTGEAAEHCGDEGEKERCGDVVPFTEHKILLVKRF